MHSLMARKLCIHVSQCPSELRYLFGVLLTRSLDDKFLSGAKCRPMIFEAIRKIDPSMVWNGKTLHRIYISSVGQLGITVKQVLVANCQCTFIISVYSDKLANLHGLCAGDIICQPFTGGTQFNGVYSWFMEAAKHRPLVFDVWRDCTTRPPTNPEHTIVPPLKKTDNPFVWTFGDQPETTRI